ncbi:hypothetical protein JWJ90_21440 [Desulfobulbus rhabdoformis]|uniref:hypothetical protein n=1 Tax=Desulfobulbus rhabdoformis TaxID=34032 RepID=UPI001966AF8D|nr:hypothetical protein [Desulfobulbus rhabdoformis]MBM9616831.1 hypothetical protein [Desulfobulbus rhabdoformis]
MKILHNLFRLAGAMIISTMLALSWQACGFQGLGKVMMILATVVASIWAMIWVGRGIYWLVLILVIGIIVLLETLLKTIKQLVLGS